MLSPSGAKRRPFAGPNQAMQNDRGRTGVGEDLAAWHFGVSLQMTSRVTEMQSPDYFVDDEQVRGPYRRFRHVHEFSQDSAGTTMANRIEFAAPFGPLDRLVEKLVLARYLKKLIDTRNRHLTGDLTPK